ncbi:MAG: (d)CMP kinase [Desulfovibrionaceae bacterium]|nr:(d)CMP kinase [Desulfovibrionaceae bacterium]
MYTTITIDGTSGAGKSSIAKTLSSCYRIPCLNSGAMFRMIAYTATSHFPTKHYTELSIEHIIDIIQSARFTLLYEDDMSTLLCNDTPLPREIYTEGIAEITSHIASYSEVRKHMRVIQRSLASNTHLIAEGRDMGTVVFPHASVKIFLTAELEERAKRRFEELQRECPDITYSQVIRQLMERDKKDTVRTQSPLKPAQDALLLDTTNRSVHDVLHVIQEYIKRKEPRLREEDTR